MICVAFVANMIVIPASRQWSTNSTAPGIGTSLSHTVPSRSKTADV